MSIHIFRLLRFSLCVIWLIAELLPSFAVGNTIPVWPGEATYN